MGQPTAAQIRALANVDVHGARTGKQFGGASVIWLLDRDYTSLRPATAAALVTAGLVTSDDKDVTITAAGRTVLAEHADVVADARADKRVLEEHQPRYVMYSRGNHPIAGWGRAPQGCQVTCSCGEFNRRVNEGRKSAQESFKHHRDQARAAARQ